MAQTFFPINPVEVTPNTPDDWIAVDGAAFGIPVNATGAVLHAVNTSDFVEYIGVRKNGSTDNRALGISPDVHTWTAIGVDVNRIFDAYVSDEDDIDIYLVGYTMAGVTFFTNAYSSEQPAAGDWNDIDYSAEAPNAIGFIFELAHYFLGPAMGLRKNGSTDNRTADVGGHQTLGAIIGCDDSQICEGYRGGTGAFFYLSGYVTDGAVFNTNATDVSLGNIGAWIDLTALPATACMGFIEVNGVPTAANYYFGLRKNGSAEALLYIGQMHPWAIVECDVNRIIEGYIITTNIDFFFVGYATKPAPPVIGIGAFHQQINPLGLNMYRAGRSR